MHETDNVVMEKLWRASAWTTVVAAAVSGSLAAYFFWRAATASGASCTLDNFDCARNRALATGMGWLMVLTALVAVGVTVWAIRRRRRRRGGSATSGA